MTFPFFPFFHVPSLVDIAIDHFSEAESQQILFHLLKTELQLSVACSMHKISAKLAGAWRLHWFILLPHSDASNYHAVSEISICDISQVARPNY